MRVMGKRKGECEVRGHGEGRGIMKWKERGKGKGYEGRRRR